MTELPGTRFSNSVANFRCLLWPERLLSRSIINNADHKFPDLWRTVMLERVQKTAT